MYFSGEAFEGNHYSLSAVGRRVGVQHMYLTVHSLYNHWGGFEGLCENSLLIVRYFNLSKIGFHIYVTHC